MEHEWQPIQFTLVVDDFGVNYKGKDHTLHLKKMLQMHYKVTADWTGKRYIGITINWYYVKRQVHISMPGFVAKALKQFQYSKPNKPQHLPFQNETINYGANKQYATQSSTAPLIDKKGKHFIQQVCGKFLLIGCAVDSTLL